MQKLHTRAHINLELLIRTIILGGFSLLFFYLWLSKKSLNFIHPRMIIFLQGTTILLVVMTVCQLRLLCVYKQTHYSNGCNFKYILFLFPILLGFFASSESLDAFLAEKKGISMDKPVLLGENDESDQDLVPELGKAEQATGFNREMIIIRDDTYSRQWYSILTELPRYLGKELEITGFVYKSADLPAGDFILARYLISCCAADAMVVGFICRYPKAEVTKNTWFRATGIIEAGIFNENEVPIIKIINLETIGQPINQYVY